MILFGADQLVAHMIGDYFLQTDKMATTKTQSWSWAIAHVLTYSIPFVIMFDLSITAFLFIVVTHLFIDHYRLARYVIIAKNLLTGGSDEKYHLKNTDACGFPKGTPDHIGFLVLIAIDNTMHVICNAFAITYL